MAQPTKLTLQYLAQLVQRVINKGNIPRDSFIKEREVIAHLRDAIHKVVQGHYFQMKNAGGGISSHYLSTFNSVAVTNDVTRGRNKATIPVEYIALPKDMGVRAVFTQTGTPSNDEPIIPIPSEYLMIASSLPAGALEQQYGYEVERDTLWFTEKDGTSLIGNSINTVRVQCVTISPQDVGDTDALPLPPELRFDVVNMVLERLGFSQRLQNDDIADEQPESVR